MSDSAPQGTPLVRVESLCKSFETGEAKVEVLSGVDLEVASTLPRQDGYTSVAIFAGRWTHHIICGLDPLRTPSRPPLDPLWTPS